MSPRRSLRPAASLLWRYGLASSSVGAAAFLTNTLQPSEIRSPFFFPAIMLSAWVGGRGPGFFAVLFSTLTLWYFVLAPEGSWAVRPADVSFLIAFGLSALVVAWLTSTRRGVEDALREQADLLDLTHDTIFVRDANDVITYWNRGAEELYGWTRHEALGKVSHELTRTIFPAPLDEINAVLSRTGRWEGELVHTKRDGTQAVVASRWSLQRGRHGAAEVLETNNDITKRRQAEEALRRVQAELAHVSRVMTMGELAASIAHEINQPLTAVVTNGNACLRWLGSEPPDLDEVREALREIIGDANRASDVLQRIRTQLKKVAPTKTRLDINDMIQEVVALARGEVVQNQVQLRTELGSHLPAVMGDRVQLQQVILNLMMNGIEAMRTITDRPRVLSMRSMREAAAVVITVQDTGIGLDPQTLDRIFDPFYTTKPEGMGMGLSISGSIVEEHGGRLWAESQSGAGATFRLRLPSENEAPPPTPS